MNFEVGLKLEVLTISLLPHRYGSLTRKRHTPSWGCQFAAVRIQRPHETTHYLLTENSLGVQTFNTNQITGNAFGNRHLSLPQTIGCSNPRECRTYNAGLADCSLPRWHQDSSADTFDTDAVPPGALDCFLVSVPCVLDIGYFSRRQGGGGCKGTTTSATLSPDGKSFTAG